jgi:hypothetical protein
MLMDHGTPWWNANGPWGWTELTVGLLRQGIWMSMARNTIRFVLTKPWQ